MLFVELEHRHIFRKSIKSASLGKCSSIDFKTCICSFLCRGLSIYKLWHRSGCSQLHLPRGFGVQWSWVLRKMHTSPQMSIHQLREITKWERHACLWVQLCTGWKICIAGCDQERFRSVWIGCWIVTKFRGVKLSHVWRGFKMCDRPDTTSTVNFYAGGG